MNAKVLATLGGSIAVVIAGVLYAPHLFHDHDAEHDSAAISEEGGAGHGHEKAAVHGGEVVMTKEFHVEVVQAAEGLRLYLYDGAQRPLSSRGVTGQVEIAFRDRTRAAIRETLEYTEKDRGGQDSLVARVDARGAEAKATFHLAGLPGKQEQHVEFTQVLSTKLDDAGQGSDHAGHHH